MTAKTIATKAAQAGFQSFKTYALPVVVGSAMIALGAAAWAVMKR